MILLIIFFSQIWKCYSLTVKVNEGTKHGIYMSEYCPETELCAEGTHVICMHNPEVYNGLGPNCHFAKNLSISVELAHEIVGVANNIRTKIASGQERGKENMTLPKAYGVWRLEWDKELATFAQVLANQCTLKHDMCRATKRFPNPGQTVGIMRFHYPSWAPIKLTQFNKFKSKGFSKELLDHAVMNIIRKWYKQKQSVSPDLVRDFQLNPKQSALTNEGLLYLQMVYGPATHVGCGVSAYTDYVFNLDNADVLYNSDSSIYKIKHKFACGDHGLMAWTDGMTTCGMWLVGIGCKLHRTGIVGVPWERLIKQVIQLVCNFSEKPNSGPIYILDKPNNGNYTEGGCPIGLSIQDSSGLCLPLPGTVPSCNGPIEQCSRDPKVILLPIFTVKDGYPPGIMKYRTNGSSHKNNVPNKITTEVNDFKHDENKFDDNSCSSDEPVIHNRRYYNNINTRSNNNFYNDMRVSKRITNDPQRNKPLSFSGSISHNDHNDDIYEMRRRYSLKARSENSIKNNLIRLLDQLEKEVAHHNLDIDEKKNILNKVEKIYENLDFNNKKESLLNDFKINKKYQPPDNSDFKRREVSRHIQDNNNMFNNEYIERNSNNNLNRISMRSANRIKEFNQENQAETIRKTNPIKSLYKNRKETLGELNLDRRMYYAEKLSNLNKKSQNHFSLNEQLFRKVRPTIPEMKEVSRTIPRRSRLKYRNEQ